MFRLKVNYVGAQNKILFWLDIFEKHPLQYISKNVLFCFVMCEETLDTSRLIQLNFIFFCTKQLHYSVQICTKPV